MSEPQKRDYNREAKDHPEHKYAYDFDRRMHKFILRTCLNFKPRGKALELGCYHGDFTALLAETFCDLTVVEASDECITIARKRVNTDVKFIHSTFENAKIDQNYDAIFLIHTLEHVDDRVGLLKKIGTWLNPGGLFFIASPNANAPSRQIAVKMGLISHNSAITNAEKAHGHTITYSLDVLEREAKDAGLNVISRGGVFFKGMANFQLDKAIESGIISDQYLEGCYQLGMIYPDLCSSIYVACSRV